MKVNKKLVVFMVVCLAAPAFAGPDEQVRIHLPREIEVESGSLTINSIGVVVCADVKLAAQAGAVAMGRGPWAREEIVIDRRTILSRLAANGIDKKQVKLSGARKVKVRHKEQLVGTEKIVGAAKAFLAKSGSESEESIWQLVGKPGELMATGSKDFELQARLARQISSNRVIVEISAVGADGVVGRSKSTFQKAYVWRQVVAVKKIRAGGVITPGNTKIRSVSISNKPRAWVSPYGMVARRSVEVGTVIGPGVVMEKTRQTIVRRGQTVVMRIKGPGFTVSTIGQVLQDGRDGDFIKVRNIDTKRVVSARVRFDGTVEPIIQEMR